MELQLGLALSNTPIPIKMFDLNSYGYEPGRGLPLPFPCDNINSNSSSSSSSSNHGSRKRGRFDDEKRDRDVPKTLPLLLWGGKRPNDEDDPKDLDEEDDYCSSGAICKNDGEGLMGWPPVKTWRKKLVLQNVNPDGEAQNNIRVAEVSDNGCGGGSRTSNSTYVKVKMEGMAIARKIDLSVHHSFETLTSTLMRMFGISDENWKSFKLTYQDRDGDWLLAEDVPWRTFIRSLKCLKLIRIKSLTSGSSMTLDIISASF